ncbi:response regulator transcription factor [Solwaraspora sp. WMMD406]|uniref:response regulator n=1 Tax=Solwaraspora sp. WMMD406 TaxID=3016095 RepID=UPI002416A21B|nr:response regulator transcription factor [Solwaraspora sp. WMMD406]MDG4765749.1 response regulator transcription factor [Solwaraspora sp. WMMD406]
MNAGTIRIVLADDHTLFREGIREMLSTDPGLAVVGSVANGDDAVALVVRHRPDVLLLDVEMPGPGAAGVIRQVRRCSPETHVIVLTMHDDSAMVHHLLDSGASAYLAKSSLRIELVAAVRSVAEQSDSVLLAVSRRTVEGLEQQRRNSQHGLLTDREVDVLTLTAQALSNGQIAARLHVTEATVKRHLTNIYAKLGAVSRIDAVRKATAARLITPADEDAPRGG